jgi:hypothetical protein
MAVELAKRRIDRIELVGTQDQYRETFGFDPLKLDVRS